MSAIHKRDIASVARPVAQGLRALESAERAFTDAYHAAEIFGATKKCQSELENKAKGLYALVTRKGILENCPAIRDVVEKEEKLPTGFAQSDPILAEVTRQVCSTGMCFSKPGRKSKLPICTSSQAKARESCIRQLKPRQKAGEIRSAFAVCTATIGCRPGRKGEK